MSNEITKAKIKDAFRKLTIKNSFAKVKVADIIAKAGISRMTFYRHYLDKYALLEEVCFDDFNLFVQIYGKNAIWKDITMSILNVIRNNGKFYKKILEDKEAKDCLFDALGRVSCCYTGKTAFRGVYSAWDGTLCNWADSNFLQAPEEIYLTLILNLPIREVLPDTELDRAVKGYENKTMEEFRKEGSATTVKTVQKKEAGGNYVQSHDKKKN